MLRLEWKNLFKNKILLVVIIAVVAIPMIYTTLFLGSMWDPYGNVDKLPVAVINLDQPAVYEDMVLSVGDELTERLKEDSSLNFCFPSKEDAEQGLKDGTYYMVITIPEDFSAHAATVTDSEAEKMIINYQTNPGTNYIASKMSESAMKELEISVREEVTGTYARVMFQMISKAGDGLSDAADGSAKLVNGAAELQDGNNTITENLQLLSDSALVFSDGSTALYEGLRQYTGGVEAVSQGASDLDSGAGQLQAGIRTMSEKAPALTDGAEQLKDGAAALYAGTSSAASGTDALRTGAADVDKNMSDLSQGLSQLETASASLPQAASALDNGVSSLSDGAEELHSGISELSDGVENLQTGADALSLGLNSVVGDQFSQSHALLSGSQNLSQAVSDLRNQLESFSDSTAGISASESDNAGFQNSLSSDEVSRLLSQLTELQLQADTLSQGIASYTAGVNEAAEGSARLAASIPSISSGIDAVDRGVDELTGGINGLKTGTAALSAQAPILTDSISGAAAGARQIQNQGTSVLKQGTEDLDSGISSLLSGAQALKDGTQDLSSQVPALTGGLSQLQNGSAALKDGSQALVSGTYTLCSNSGSLLSGSKELSDGAGQIADGAALLADGSANLGTGLNQVSEGAKELEEALKDGAVQIEETNTSDSTADMFAAPVDTKETQITDVENNGHAMAPYMMSVGLWVGCIAFSLMYPLTSYCGKMKSGIRWWLSKASVLYVISVLQAIVMIAALCLFDGFHPAQMGRTVLAACIASLAFMSVMYFFTSLLGRVGSFLMLVFMVIQLAGSVGTYPLEISGSFVPYLHGWVPFTYTVEAFRSTISGGESILGCLTFLLILFAVFTLLTIVEFHIRARKIRNGQNTWTLWLEEHGLA